MQVLCFKTLMVAGCSDPLATLLSFDEFTTTSYFRKYVIIDFFSLFSDVDRQKKTKEIMGGLGSQEGEYRKFMASKKRKK